jgi:serine/threonine protein kinase
VKVLPETHTTKLGSCGLFAFLPSVSTADKAYWVARPAWLVRYEHLTASAQLLAPERITRAALLEVPLSFCSPPQLFQQHLHAMGAFLEAPDPVGDNANQQQTTSLDNLDDVLDYMDKHMASTIFREQKQIFLLQAALDAITTETVIRNLVSQDNELDLEQHAQEEFVQEVFAKGRKMFATCIFSAMSLTCVQALFDDGLTDTRFPFEEDECPGLKSNRKFRTTFLVNQSRFHTAYFKPDSEHQWDNRITKPIDFNEGLVLGAGTFGFVYEIWIHPGQRSFKSGNDNQSSFAMKVTRQQGTREVSFHRAMASIPPHPHLLRCLASFTFSSNYHMVYEKANSDVEKFMEQNSDAQGLRIMEPKDLAQQLYGLASALSAIHNNGQTSSIQSTSLLSVPVIGPERAGYIHDIKPENILVFLYEQNGSKKHWFRLSDFSCAKVNDIQSSISGKSRNSWKTVSKSGTPVYRAPEATGKEGRTSRPYDLWSLGCVYLEILVWYLEGYQSLRRFRETRECHVVPEGREDEGFYFKPAVEAAFELRKVVVDKIESVKSQCEGPLRDIANVIPDLLRIDPRCRPTAEKLVIDLKHVGKGVEPPVAVTPSVPNLTKRLESLSLPTFESDPSLNLNNIGGPVLNVDLY